MTYQAEQWAPLPIPVDVFHIALETTENLKTLLGATSVRVAYNKGGTILVEWTMMHRETFAGLVGEYIIRNENHEFEVVSAEELASKYAPVIETLEEERADKLAELGKVLAVNNRDGVAREILFQLPDGTPAVFVRQEEASRGTIVEEKLKTSKYAEAYKEADLSENAPRPNPGNIPKKKQGEN